MGVRPLRDEPNIWTHQGFLFAEDKALKDHLSGITVPGREVTTPRTEVGVWFRWPEGERQIRYPFITIDLLQADPAFDLFTSDHWEPTTDLYRPSYAPTLPAPPGGYVTQAWAIRNYLPFRLMYQVSVHSRNALHDRYLQSIFRSDAFPPRPFWIWCDVDETWRRTEVTQAANANLSETTESGTKRIFRMVYTLNMLAEVPQDRILDSWTYKVLRTLIPVTSIEEFDDYYTNVLKGVTDPIGSFTATERMGEGEYFHVAHEGREVLPLASPTTFGYGEGPYGLGGYGGTS